MLIGYRGRVYFTLRIITRLKASILNLLVMRFFNSDGAPPATLGTPTQRVNARHQLHAMTTTDSTILPSIFLCGPDLSCLSKLSRVNN